MKRKGETIAIRRGEGERRYLSHPQEEPIS